MKGDGMPVNTNKEKIDDDLKKARKWNKQSLFLSITAMVLSVIALVIRLIGVLR